MNLHFSPLGEKDSLPAAGRGEAYQEGEGK